MVIPDGVDPGEPLAFDLVDGRAAVLLQCLDGLRPQTQDVVVMLDG